MPSQPRSRSRSQRPAPPTDASRQAVPPPGSVRGRVVRSHGLWHEVVTDGATEPVIATVRGQLKRHRRGTDVVAVGDRVWIALLPDNEAVIEYVEPRVRTLGRTARHTRDVEQVILANPDQVLFVFAIHEPAPHLRMLDRFIILAELQEIPIRIVITKMDLDSRNGGTPARELLADHARVFPVHFISAVTGEGMDDLQAALAGKVSAIAGPSGVGKSSLLNVLDPGTDRETSTVSTATGKGRHTTVGARLHQLDATTFVADTPGMRAIAMRAVPSDTLDWCFRELRPYLGECFYQDCVHISEPDCAVRAAVAAGDVAASRYESYVALRQGDEITDTPEWA